MNVTTFLQNIIYIKYIEYEDDNTGHAAMRWDHWYRTLNHWSLSLDTGHGGGDGAHALLLPIQLIHPHQHAASLSKMRGFIWIKNEF